MFKVICINDMGVDGHKLQIKFGEEYTASLCPQRDGYYIIQECPKFRGSNVCYEETRFIILPNADELQLVNEKQLVNHKNFFMSEKEMEEMMDKANKWDALDKKIAACYFYEDGNELEDGDEVAGLITVGEIAAMAFGYL